MVVVDWEFLELIADDFLVVVVVREALVNC